jgi:phosphomannomutase
VIINDPETVDLILYDAQTDTYSLIIAPNERLLGSDHELRLLKLKLDNYILFIKSGQMAVKFPESINKRVSIIVDCHYGSPLGPAATFLASVSQSLQTMGIPLTVESDPDSGGHKQEEPTSYPLNNPGEGRGG